MKGAKLTDPKPLVFTERHCLRCQKLFASRSLANRLCAVCNNANAKESRLGQQQIRLRTRREDEDEKET